MSWGGPYKPVPGTKEIEPVREFTGDPRRLAGSVLGELQRMRASIAEELATVDLKTFEEYRNRRGKIDGLDIAINICKEVQKKLES